MNLKKIKITTFLVMMALAITPILNARSGVKAKAAKAKTKADAKESTPKGGSKGSSRAGTHTATPAKSSSKGSPLTPTKISVTGPDGTVRQMDEIPWPEADRNKTLGDNWFTLDPRSFYFLEYAETMQMANDVKASTALYNTLVSIAERSAELGAGWRPGVIARQNESRPGENALSSAPLSAQQMEDLKRQALAALGGLSQTPEASVTPRDAATENDSSDDEGESSEQESTSDQNDQDESDGD